MGALSPPVLVLLCWSLTGILAAITLALPDVFDLVPLFMAREQLDTAAFTATGALWIFSAASLFLLVDAVTARAVPQARAKTAGIDPQRAAWTTFWVNLALIFVTLVWIGATANRVGGLSRLAALAYIDSLAARDLLLETKLFTGMRLFYAALPATGALAAILLAGFRRQLAPGARRALLLTLILNCTALVLLPIVMSQRLLLLQFLLSAYLGTCIVHRRVVGLVWVIPGVAVFLGVWILRESLTNPMAQRLAADIGMQKLGFYFVNDLWNAFAPLNEETPPALGAVSLRGLMFLTFTDGLFDRVLADRLIALEEIRGGGDFPLFTAPFVDFGALGGAIFIALCAGVFRYLHRAATRGPGWALIYAQLGAALLFSSHGIYFTHQNFLFSLAVCGIVLILSRRDAPAPGPRGGRFGPGPSPHHAAGKYGQGFSPILPSDLAVKLSAHLLPVPANLTRPRSAGRRHG